MATKKPTKKTTKPAARATEKPAPKKAAATTVTRIIKPKAVAATARRSKKLDTSLPNNLVNIVVAETIGTFVLTLVALFSAYFMAPFYVGLTLMLMVMAVGAISGSHINPAVTFGLWSMRKLKTVLVPFYWASQFLGAMAAVVLIGSLSGGGFALHFDQFTTFSWGIFGVELVGMAVFMFGIAAALQRSNLKQSTMAVAIGMSLTVGLLVAGTLLPYVQNAAVTKHQAEQEKLLTTTNTEQKERSYPREVYIGGATLNPAVALAVTEKTESQLQSNAPAAQKNEKAYTRLGLEVIAATLVGAALGGNLFLLVNYRTKTEESA
ncbi:MAG: aquaporin [Candidatus Saccharibacteria bacterium]|nr:aquaporin [Candidatus Saccharibacteria bacterium]